jgi:hypothetical protein
MEQENELVTPIIPDRAREKNGQKEHGQTL